MSVICKSSQKLWTICLWGSRYFWSFDSHLNDQHLTRLTTFAQISRKILDLMIEFVEVNICYQEKNIQTYTVCIYLKNTHYLP